jgi:hypothetical protein
MAIRNNQLGGSDWVAHEKLKATDVNDTFNAAIVIPNQVYTGTDFDCSQSGTGVSSNDHILYVAGGAIINYVKISFLLSVSAKATDSSSASTINDFKIETAENGGAFTIRLNSNILSNSNSGGSGASIGESKLIEFYYAPTVDEKTNGLDIKITGTITCSKVSGSASGSISNIQTIVWVN